MCKWVKKYDLEQKTFEKISLPLRAKRERDRVKSSTAEISHAGQKFHYDGP